MTAVNLERINTNYHQLHLIIEEISSIIEPLHKIFETIDFDIVCSPTNFIVHPEDKTRFSELVKVDEIITQLTIAIEKVDRSEVCTQQLYFALTSFRNQLKTAGQVIG